MTSKYLGFLMTLGLLLSLLFLRPPAAQAMDAEDAFDDTLLVECIRPLRREFDIRNYTKTPDRRPEISYELWVTVGGAKYSMTIQTLGSRNRVQYQVIRHALPDSYVEEALNRFASELSGVHERLPFADGPVLKGTLSSVNETTLQQEVERAAAILRAALHSNTFFATNVRKTAKSLTAQALFQLLIEFLRRNGMNEEDRFFKVRIPKIHQELIDSLTSKERIFFDYALFDTTLGFPAEARASEIEALWKQIEPDSPVSYQDVHEGIRQKLIESALRNEASYRNQITSNVFVLEKVQRDLARWLKRNPLERLIRYHEIAESGVATEDDVKMLLALDRFQEPTYAAAKDLVRRRQIRQLYADRLNPRVTIDTVESAKVLTAQTMREWARQFPTALLNRIDLLAHNGVSIDDVEFVLALDRSLLQNIETWDRDELKKMISSTAPATNLNPFSIEIDQRNAWTNPIVQLSVIEQKYILGKGSWETVRQYLPALPSSFSEQKRKKVIPGERGRD